MKQCLSILLAMLLLFTCALAEMDEEDADYEPWISPLAPALAPYSVVHGIAPAMFPDRTLNAPSDCMLDPGQTFTLHNAPYEEAFPGITVYSQDIVNIFGYTMDTWLLIEYRLSEKQHIIGWIEMNIAAGAWSGSIDLYVPCCIAITTDVSTALTFDPMVSQAVEQVFPAGTHGILQNILGDWAYVSLDLNESQLVFGFVPVSSLSLEIGTFRFDLIEQMVGDWEVLGDDSHIYSIEDGGVLYRGHGEEEFGLFDMPDGLLMVTLDENGNRSEYHVTLIDSFTIELTDGSSTITLAAIGNG